MRGTVTIYAAQVPSGLLDLLRIPGLGPKKVKLLHDELGIESIEQLEAVTQDVIARAKNRKELVGLQSTIRATTPQIYVDVDREKAETLEVPVDDVYGTLQMSGIVAWQGEHAWGVFVQPFGFLLTQYTITGFDASAHLSEETATASKAAAKGIWRSIAYSVSPRSAMRLGLRPACSTWS